MTHKIPASYDLFIGNQWHKSASAETMPMVSPLTGETLTRVPVASKADIDAAVKAGKAAFPKWADMPSRKRQDILNAMADALVADIKRIAWLETTNCGKPWRESYANVMTASDRLRYYAGACRVLEGKVLPVTRDIMSMDLRQPLGLVGVIGAWNFPLNMFVGKIAPVLAAGNCVLYKPAEPTPITTLEIAKLWEKILPPGVLNVVTGDGPTTGAAIVDHPGIRMISVTGASETGKLVMAGGARTLKRLALELGGKNAQIVFPDANLDRAAQGILLGAFMNQGQVCTAGSRIFAHRKIAADLRAKIIGLIPKLKIGNPYDEKTEMGTLSSQEHLDKVLSYVALGRDEGAQVAAGGSLVKLEEFPRGLFMAPTILDKVEPGMRVAQEEIFGPVAAFFEWEDEAAMLEAANGVEQGLAAGIWTENLSRAHSTARAVEAGRVWVNCYNLFPSGASFGGMKASGYGREDAFETLFEFTEVKNVIMDTAPTFRKFYD